MTFRTGIFRRSLRPLCSGAAALVLLSFALGGPPAKAQRPGALRLDHAIGTEPWRPAPAGATSSPAAPETLRILAAMIEFLPDNDARSSGPGTFDLSETLDRRKDPAPHDAGYFELHLSFLRNYYRDVSGGMLEIEATLLPDIHRLSRPMRDYSPPRGSTDNAGLGALVADAWTLVDSASPGVPFSLYDAFVIFHAGVGRDIDLVSIYGYDPTPFDIPSLYLGLGAMKKIFGESYAGVPVNGGAFHITSSMIIPETESRNVPVIGGTTLLELGINGLLAANVGSHLGLPDLFDTRTGRSGIGRFGLMDGQSIFSWNGFLPPEPSAWEKAYLGWVSPLTVSPGSAVLEFPAVGSSGVPDTIYRVPVSTGEYFLMENRNRDAAGDGQTVTYVWAGDTLTRTWARDTTGFTFVDQDSLYGVMLDADDFDWSLPGGTSARTGEWFDGGLLIWHIDETVIDGNLASGTVNADPARRGVDIEEADGSQDIGQSYGFISSGSGSEDGTVLDFWYAGNQAPLRVASNVFGPASNPPSLGNNFTNSHITVSEFSARGPRMTARVALGDSIVSPIPGFPKETAAAFPSGAVAGPDQGVFAVVSPGPSPGVYGWTTAGGLLIPGGDPSGTILVFGGTGAPDSLIPRAAIGQVDADAVPDLIVAGSRGDSGILLACELADIDADFLADPLYGAGIVLPSRATTPAVLGDSFVSVGTASGAVYRVLKTGGAIEEFRPFGADSSAITGLALLPGSGMPGSLLVGSAAGNIGALLGPACVDSAAAAGGLPDLGSPVRPVSARFRDSDDVLLDFGAVTDDGTAAIGALCAGLLTGFPRETGGASAGVPAAADLDGDGRRELVFFAGRMVHALNHSGAPLDGFPARVGTASDLAGSPVVADLDGDGSADIAGVTSEGIVFALDRSGTMLAGFPLQAGANSGVTPGAFYYTSDCLSCAEIGIAVATGDGTLYAWNTGTLTTGPAAPPAQPWPQFARDSRNTASADSILPPAPRGGDYLPPSRTYNWPNPVGKAHGYLTHIRYFVPADATVSVKIFDLAGNLVHAVDGLAAQGGLDNEIPWDASGVQSGVYYARIEASGQTGSGTAVVTIAVVK